MRLWLKESMYTAIIMFIIKNEPPVMKNTWCVVMCGVRERQSHVACETCVRGGGRLVRPCALSKMRMLCIPGANEEQRRRWVVVALGLKPLAV